MVPFWTVRKCQSTLNRFCLCFWYCIFNLATCIRLRHHFFDPSPKSFKSVSPRTSRHPITGASSRHAFLLSHPATLPSPVSSRVGFLAPPALPRRARTVRKRARPALTPAIAHSYVRRRAEDPGTLDVEDGVPPPRAAPALLRRVVLNLSTVRRSCSPPFGCGARNTSTTSSCRSPSTALGPLGTRTSTTGRGKAKWGTGTLPRDRSRKQTGVDDSTIPVSVRARDGELRAREFTSNTKSKKKTGSPLVRQSVVQFHMDPSIPAFVSSSCVCYAVLGRCARVLWLSSEPKT